MGYERECDMFRDFIKQGWAQRKMSWKISRAIYKKTGVVDEIPQPTIKYRIDRLRGLGRLETQICRKYQRNPAKFQR